MELDIGQELDGSRNWIIVTYLLSLYPGIPRWDDSHDVYIYALQRHVFRDNSVSIEEAESPIALLPAKFMLTERRAQGS